MNRLSLNALGLILVSSICAVSQSPPPPVNENTSTAKIAITGANRRNKAKSSQNLSECAKKITGLAKNINVPQEFCVDITKPADKGETMKVPSAYNAAYSYYDGTDLPFDKLPAEVRKIVKLTAPAMDTKKVVFNLLIVPSDDPKFPNKIVKGYNYSSATKEKKAGPDPNLHTWIFRRQNRLLKLDSAELASE